MFKITAKQTKDKIFIEAFARIGGYRKFPVKKLNWVLRWHRALQTAIEEMSEKHREMLRKYAELDEGGNFVPYHGQPGTYALSKDTQENPEKLNTYWEEMKKFNTIEKEIDTDPLPFSLLQHVELSPAEVIALGGSVKVDNACQPVK
jgi:hypothetical protein